MLHIIPDSLGKIGRDGHTLNAAGVILEECRNKIQADLAIEAVDNQQQNSPGQLDEA